MKVAAPSLAPILRSDTQGRVLAAVFDDPRVERTVTEIAGDVGRDQTTVLREVRRAEEAGLVTSRKIGTTRFVRADTTHPFYVQVRQIVVGTYGVPRIIAAAFGPLVDALAVLVYGSWAARFAGVSGMPPRDIDVLVIGPVALRKMHESARTAEAEIGAPVQAVARSLDAWVSADDSFIVEVKSRPLLPVLVTENDHEALRAELADLAARFTTNSRSTS